METRSDYSLFGRQIIYFIGVAIAIQLLGFIQFPIITKSIGPTYYGILNIITTTIALVVPVASIGFRSSLIRFLAAEKNKSRISEDFIAVFSIVFISGLVFSALLFLFSNIIATEIIKNSEATPYIKIASILILLNTLFELPIGFFSAQRNMGIRASILLAKDVLLLLLIVIFINLNWGLNGIILALIFSNLIINIASFTIIFRNTGISVPKLGNSVRYLKWGLPLIPNSALLWIIHISDRYMVSYFLGVTSAGIYSAAYTMGNYASFLLIPIGIVIYPNIFKSYDEGKIEETKRYFKYTIKYLMMITIPAAFGISILAKSLLRILTTSAFVSGSIIVPVVAAAAVVYCFYQISIYVIHAVNKTRLTVRLLLMSVLINVVLNLILIPIMGIMGAAVATLIAYAALGIVSIVITQKYIKFDLSLPFIGKSIFASIVMSALIWLFNPKSLVFLIISIIGGALIYFIVLFLIRGFNKNEITFFIHFVKEHLSKIWIIKR
jgi:O-antigen/teichoic acid export membrane protein